MGVPTSEVGYTPAMPRREDHEVHKGHVVALGNEIKYCLMFWFLASVNVKISLMRCEAV